MQTFGFGSFGVNLVEYQMPEQELGQCYIPLRIATQGLMNYSGTLGIATQGLIDLPCIVTPEDIWKEIVRFTTYIKQKVEFDVER